MSASTPESRIKRRVTAALKELGLWYFFPASGAFGKAGIPDIVTIAPNGQFIGIECKADPSKKPTVLQLQCGKQIVAAGGNWFLVRSYEDVNKLVEELKCLTKSNE
jgi:Holliday junction resolvase